MSPRKKAVPVKVPAAPPEHETLAAPPSWVRPKEHDKTRMSFFYARPGVRIVRQAIFFVDAAGAVFLDLVTHTPVERTDTREGALVALPACVLEAAAAEHRRKVREGR